MKNFYLSIVLSFVALLSPSAMAQQMDIPKCKALIAASDSILIQQSQYAFMISQCRILTDCYLEEVKRIKQLSGLEARKKAADAANEKYDAEYDLYERMIRLLKEVIKKEDAAKQMGNLNLAETWHLLGDKVYIDKMFTIFRSKYEF